MFSITTSFTLEPGGVTNLLTYPKSCPQIQAIAPQKVYNECSLHLHFINNALSVDYSV